MKITASINIIFILALCLLSACTSIQPPTQLDQSSDRLGGLEDMIPSGDGNSDWSLDELESRGGLLADNKFGEYTMVSGTLPSIYFDFDSSSISASERIKLQEAADYLDRNPGARILIEGHCDWYGTSEYNLALGDRRASSASDYLATLGVETARIEKLSKGSLEALTGLPKFESAQDRRADLILLQK